LGQKDHAIALEMERTGKSREDIWHETGWWKDGKDWKFEIDDNIKEK
jgi:hypothetical protein